MAETELERFRRIGRALDGDSLVRKDGSVTRVLGGNTPERMHVNAGESLPDMPGSVAATYALQRSLDNGAEVTDTGERGFFGRPLQRVTDDKGDVMGDMVALGLADPSAENTHQQFRENVERPEWDDLVDHARQEKAEFVDRRFEDMVDALFGSTNYRGRQVSKRDGGWEITKDAVARGTDQFQGSLYAFANVLGETFGSDVLSEYGEEGMFRNMYEAALNPARVASYEDIDGYRDLGLYVLETVAENSPALAADIVAGAATGGATVLGKQALAGIGKSAMRKFGMSKAMTGAGKLAEQAWSLRGLTTSTGAKVGMAGSMFPQMAGETRMGQYRDGLENEDGAATQALVTGGLQTGLELVGLQKMLGNVMKGLDPGDAGSVMGLVKEAKDVQGLLDVLGRAAGLGLSGGATETVTEITQELISQISTMGLDPDMEVSFDNLDETALTEAGARAFAFGGPVTAAGATVTGVAGMRENLRREILKGQQPTTDDTAPEPVDNLKAHAEVRGAVWLSPQHTAEEKEVLRAELAQQGEVFERTNDAGATYLTTRSDDPLLNPEVELTGDELTRQKGFVPKSELAEGEERHTAVVRDAQGREIEAIVTDDTNLDSTLAKLDELYPELTVAVEPAEQVLERRREARSRVSTPDLAGLETPNQERSVVEAADALLGPEQATKRLGDVPPSEARDTQLTRSQPAPKEERNTASPYLDGQRGGPLRPVGELIADLKSGRLDMEAMKQAAMDLGVNATRFFDRKTAVDLPRTVEAIRRKLTSNKELADRYSGIARQGVRSGRGLYSLVDDAMKALANADDFEVQKALAELDMKPVQREEVTGDNRRRLMPRLKAKIKADKTPKPVIDRAARQFVGEGASADSLVKALEMLSGEQLMLLADMLGGVKTKDLATPVKGVEGDDVSGLLGEMVERSVSARPAPKVRPATGGAPLQNPAGVRAAGESGQGQLDLNAGQAGTVTQPARVIDQGIQDEKAATRDPDMVDALDAEDPLEDREGIDTTSPEYRKVFIAQAARDLGIIERLVQLTKLSDQLDFKKLLRAYFHWNWPRSTKEVDKLVAMTMGDVREALNKADPEQVTQTLRNLIRYAETQDILADTQYETGEQRTAALGAALKDTSAEQALANGIAGVYSEDPSQAESNIVEVLTQHGFLGDKATLFEQEIKNPTSNSGSAIAEGYPAALDRDPQEQSDRTFYRAVYQATLKLSEHQYLEQGSAEKTPDTRSQREKTYGDVRLMMLRPTPFEATQDALGGLHYQRDLLKTLVELGAIKFDTRLTPFIMESTAKSEGYTKKANGENLIRVEYEGEELGPDGTPVNTYTYFRWVDAIALAQYAKDRHPVTAEEALANLESNLSRLVQGPESAQVRRNKAKEVPTIPDSAVIWVDKSGQFVTAGQARDARRDQSQLRNRVVEASRRGERLAVELDEVTEIIHASLDQLHDSIPEGDTDTAGVIATIRESLERGAPTARQKNRNRANSQTRRLEEAPESGAAWAKTEYDTAKAAQEHLTSVAKLASVRIGRGVVAPLKQLLDRRIALLVEIKALDNEIQAGAGNMTTSLRGLKAELNTRLGESGLESETDPKLAEKRKAQLQSRVDKLRKDRESGRANTEEYRESRRRANSSAELSDQDIAEDGFDQKWAAQLNNPDSPLVRDAQIREDQKKKGVRDGTESRAAWDQFGDPRQEEPDVDEVDDDPLDAAAYEAGRDDELTGVEWDAEALRNAAQFEAWQVAASNSAFYRLGSPQRGVQMVLDAPLTEKGRKAKARAPGPAPAPKPTKRPFAGTKVIGKAAKRQSMQALASFTRRLVTVVAKGMHGEQRTRFLNTPLVIVETGDIEALKQIAKEAGREHFAPELGKLAARPGYLNLGPVSVISMDRLTPSMNPAEWSLVFGHELGHMVYDQSWHLMSEDDKAAIIRIYTDSYGASGYNGKDGGLGFKEWFADQMSAAIAKDVTANRPDAYNNASGVLGKAMQFIMRNLKAMWAAIQKGQATRKLTRFKLNLEFDEFAQRILTGKMPMSHRYNLPFAEVQTLHFTPDESPLPRSGSEARMKQAHKGKLKPTGLFRSVIGRIRDYSTELANLLHQSANQSRAGDGAYEQKRYAMGNLWMAELQKAYDQIGRGRNQQEKVNQAYAELREGKDTAGAKALREVLDRIISDAKKRGWASGYSLEADFVPRAFNHKAVETKRGRLFELAKKALPKATDEEINDQIDRIVDGFGLQGLEHEPMGPGRPVGTHAGAKTLLDAVGHEKLTKEGLLQDKGYGMLQHFVAGVAKRAAWESTFGGYVDRQGAYSPAMQASARRLARAGETVFFDPNARYKQLLETIAAEHGDHAAAEVKDLVLGAMGHRNLGVKKWARVSQEWATGITNLMILGFSGVASIPELATAFVRADFGFADIAASLRNYGEAKRFAYDIGVAMTTGAEQAMRESMGEGYQSSAINKANSVFFTLNGQQFITRLSRTVGTAVAMRYVLKAAAEGDYASLKKLGLTPEQVRQWDRAGRPAYTADMQGPLAETALAVSNGVSQFVNEGTLNPNKFQSANWGNNPYMKVIWHLKQFLWTFGDTVVGGIARSVREQYQQGKAAGYSAPLSALMATATPMWAMGLMMPLAAMSLALRGLLAGQDRFEDEELDDLAIELMRKTGAFAQWDLLHGLLTANKWDQGWVSYPGAVIPMVSVADQIIAVRDGQLDLEQSAKNLAGMAPLAGQWKGTWQWLLE